jgi:hypothetical protein
MAAKSAKKVGLIPLKALRRKGEGLMPVIPSEFEGSRKISPGVYPEFAEGVEMTSLPNLATLRLCGRNIRIRESLIPGII